MRLATRTGLVSALGLLAAVSSGCGDKPEAPTGSTSGASASATGAGGGATSSSSTGTSSSSSSGTGGSGPTLFNGCDPTATCMPDAGAGPCTEDHTMDTMVDIAFGGPLGTQYKPACIRVKSGTMVTWTGDFNTHPLDSGIVLPMKVPAPDPTNPIKPTTGNMNSVTFAISPAGMWGYYCDEHFGINMKGAVFAE